MFLSRIILENCLKPEVPRVVQWAWRGLFCKQVVQFQKTLSQAQLSPGMEAGSGHLAMGGRGQAWWGPWLHGASGERATL